MREFELLQPRNLPEALDLLASNTVRVRPLAGGTDMLVDIRAGRAQPEALVALQNVSELRGITRENGTLRIGASITLSEFLKHPQLLAFDALSRAAYLFANPLIRNLATIAGNLGSASPAGDMLPPLLAFDAQLELIHRNGTRTVPLAEYFTGPRKTVRQPDELIAAIQLAAANLEPSTASSFYKLGLRQADAISLVSVAVWLRRDGSSIGDVRIALGAVAPRPLRATRAEELVRGQPYSETLVAQAARVAADECSPIDDLRASASYRKRMVQVYVRRMLEQTWEKTK